MTRSYDDPVQVRTAVPESAMRGEAVVEEPEAFLWRGRLYLVRAVLAHWRERHPWWRTATDDRRPSPPTRRETAPAADLPPGMSAGRGVVTVQHADTGLAHERHVWRVEAGSGRMNGTGVYDLAWTHDGKGGEGRWQLVRVAD